MTYGEWLAELRALNALEGGLRTSRGDGARGEACRREVEAVRARLPMALLAHHDRMAARGLASVAAVRGEACGACGAALSPGQLAGLNHAGRMDVCPRCGVFLFNAMASIADPRE